MFIPLHEFNEPKFIESYNKLPLGYRGLLRFVPRDYTLLDDVYKMSKSERLEALKQAINIREIDYLNAKWIWTGTWTGESKQPVYEHKNVIRDLYHRFIDPDLTSRRRLTVFTSECKSDVNPYCVGMSISPKGCRRISINARKTNPDLSFSNIKIPSNLEDSSDYEKALFELVDSGFKSLGGSFKEEAKHHLLSEGFGLDIVNFIIEKEMNDE